MKRTCPEQSMNSPPQCFQVAQGASYKNQNHLAWALTSGVRITQRAKVSLLKQVAPGTFSDRVSVEKALAWTSDSGIGGNHCQS